MDVPLRILNRLSYGRVVACEVVCEDPDFRAFVEVIPVVDAPHYRPDVWNLDFPGEPRLRSSASIRGYEVRYLKHNKKFNAEDWGWDYDYVLADPTTRVRRVFIKDASEIPSAVSPWLADCTLLRHPTDIDSSLVGEYLDSYLNSPERFPHLWK